MCLVSRTVGRHRVVGGTNLIQFSWFALVFRLHLSVGRAPSSSPPPPPTAAAHPPAAALSSAEVFSPATTDSTNPLSSLLPLSVNPFNATVDLITSRLKQQQQQQQLYDDELGGGGGELLEAHLLPFLRPQEVSRILLRCQSLPLASLRFFRWTQSHVLPSPHNFALLAHILASSAHSSQALCILSDFVRTYTRVDDAFQALLAASAAFCNGHPAVFGMLVKVYTKLGRTSDALETCRRAIELGLAPDAEAFNCLLNSLAKSRSLDLCWDLFGEMRRIGVPLNSYTFNILIHALCRGSSKEDIRAEEFLEEMESEGFDPDVITYNTLMDGYCRRGMLEDAFHLYRIMRYRGVEPDLISYTILMNGLCRDGKVIQARQLFDTMLRRGVCPDSRSYNVLLSGYCREGKLKESKLLVQEMISGGLVPDDFTCSTIVEAHIQGRKLLPCLNLIALLHKIGIIISVVVYKCLINALCMEGRPSAARSLLKQMQLDGYEPDLEIYNSLMDSFCKCESLESEALALKNEMVGKGVRPDIVTYQILIKCLCRSGKTFEGECLMKEMIECDIQPDPGICSALVGGCCEKRDLSKAESLLVYFAEKFQIYENSGYNSLIRLYCHEREMSETMELQDRLQKLGLLMMKAQTRRLPVENLEGSKGLGDVANAHHDLDQSDGVYRSILRDGVFAESAVVTVELKILRCCLLASELCEIWRAQCWTTDIKMMVYYKAIDDDTTLRNETSFRMRGNQGAT
ncbi:hypothetical protein MUK42_21088 [Musa troglodytarum]|uniref:Pentatricopeptide repeat-containing protein n=1 Tax=Musa troglodytarum TaxID=320322 RepID=A0A9E7FXK5_9LILI|nr:hypothetical protein MUK42_21088 [Musa troglodytarum]